MVQGISDSGLNSGSGFTVQGSWLRATDGSWFKVNGNAGSW